MGDANPIRPIGDYSRLSHEGYRNTIGLPKGNNVELLRSDTIRLVRNGCSLHELRSEDPNQLLKDFLKLVDSLDLDVANSKRTHLHLFQSFLCNQASNWLECLLAGSIFIWEELTTCFLAQFIPPGRTAKLRLTPKIPSSWHRLLALNSNFYDHVSFHLKFKIGRVANGKLRNKNAKESWKIIENLALYDYEGWNDSKDFVKPVKAIFTPQRAPKTPDRRLLELEDQINFLLKGSRPTPRPSSIHIPQAYAKEREEINDRMTEMFRLFKKLTTSRAPVKVLMREEAKHLVTKNVYSILLIRREEEKNDDDNATTDDSIERPDELDVKMPLKRGLKHMNALVDQGSDVNVMPLFTYRKLTDKRPVKMDIRLSLASHSYIYPLGIAKDVLVDVVGYGYPIHFVILDIKEDEKRPFILGTPFLTTAKAVIKFDIGTVTLRSGMSKISFHKIPESLCKIEKVIKNDTKPIAPIMTINRLVLEWEERIKLHQEKEMEFDQWRSKDFENKHPALVKDESEMNDEGEVT
uniref:MAK10-like protein n=1 Tax=Tanacetum cinerariifolium TaxID=118510 RepID=A0A699I6L5_TANCI|nr:MAK10-like protein [Tanacetum cinerariifolium]